MWLSLSPSSLPLSLSLSVAPSVWLTAWPCSCWQLRLPPQDNICPPHLSLHLSIHPSMLYFPFLLPLSSGQMAPFVLFLLLVLHSPPSLPPLATPTIRSHLSVCTSAIRAPWQPNASHVPELHTHTHTHTHPHTLKGYALTKQRENKSHHNL